MTTTTIIQYEINKTIRINYSTYRLVKWSISATTSPDIVTREASITPESVRRSGHIKNFLIVDEGPGKYNVNFL